jgi:alkylhydroperoxidase/carboxymuconolactone decarboxylase family protein YurZ
MEAHALAHLGIGGNIGESSHPATEDRTEALARIGAAHAVNCVSSLKTHMASAEALGVSKKEMAEIVRLAAFIKEKAASHVEHLTGASAGEAKSTSPDDIEPPVSKITK